MKLKIKKMRNDARIPRQQSDGASGMDLHAAEDAMISNGTRRKMPTGIAVQPVHRNPGVAHGGQFWMEQRYECQVRPRSGNTLRGLDVGFGTIDPDYTGEVAVTIINCTGEDVWVHKGDRVAQLVVAPIPRVELEEVEELEETKRGSAGHGSTGV